LIVDCHVNVREDRQLTPLLAEQMARIRRRAAGVIALRIRPVPEVTGFGALL
jgi:hypothetical protein